MTNSPEHVELETLRRELESVRAHTMPAKTQEALKNVLQILSRITHKLEENEEQSRLAALYRVSQMLGTSLKLDEVLNNVMDAVIELTGAERGFLMLQAPESSKLVLRAARNFERETLTASSMQVSRTVIDTVINTGKGVVTTNAQNDPRFARQESVIRFALRSILCVPLRARGKTIGAIYVDNRAKTGLFDQDDLSLLNAFATQAAVAIENARLYTQTDQSLAARVSELETLSKIDHELTARLELDHVVEITRDWAMRGTSAEQCWVALYGVDQRTLNILSGPQTGLPFGSLKPEQEKLLRESSPVLIPKNENHPACLFIPLNGTSSQGVLVLQKSSSISDSDREFLLRLAARSTGAIENARLYEAIQQANQAKSKFVSVVSHELRLPMTSIKGYTDLLLQGMVGPLNDQQNQFLDVIRNNVERMQVLVSDLSDISRIETGRMRLEISTFPLQEYISQVLESLGQRLQGKNQSLELNLPDNLPMCNADPNRVVQVLSNLISNAWKYTPEGGHVSISVQPRGDHLYIEISDDGIGISPADQLQLFNQFFRSEESAVRDQPGWGLGLHVTKQIVELMGGQIGMQSEHGKGSTFWFTLPASSENA